MAENQKENLKLTKEELNEIELLISYYSTLGKDNDTKEGKRSEEAITSALIKLKNFYNKKHGRKL